jgi:L-rhamnose-H+ transport protein
MHPNPFLGVFFHWLGGLASGSFYVPYRFVRKWAWEVYWLVGGFFSWIIAPWLLATILTPDLLSVLKEAPWTSLRWAYIFGAMWGLGGLTFGLTMRYLGMSLGMGVALGYCAAFGTLIPPIFRGTFVSDVLGKPSGIVILIGVVICLLGIAVAGMAGMSKEREMSEEQKKATIKEFNFKKGILVATFSGIMSASFAYGLAAGDPIKELALKYNFIRSARADGFAVQNATGAGMSEAAWQELQNPAVKELASRIKDPGLKEVVVAIARAGGNPLKYQAKHELWQGLPVLVVVLLGGFTTNFIWCVLLNFKNKTGSQYFNSAVRPQRVRREDETIIETAIDAPSEEVVEHIPAAKKNAIEHAPMLANYFFSALAGVTWYMQFFFYTMGETQMGQYKFSSWTLHMASIIIFSSLWGIGLREWKGSSGFTKMLLALGLLMLIFSTVVVGYGNKLGVTGGQ